MKDKPDKAWKIRSKLKDEIIGELVELRGAENLCGEEDHLTVHCPSCEFWRRAIECCEGVVRAVIKE